MVPGAMNVDGTENVMLLPDGLPVVVIWSAVPDRSTFPAVGPTAPPLSPVKVEITVVPGLMEIVTVLPDAAVETSPVPTTAIAPPDGVAVPVFPVSSLSAPVPAPSCVQTALTIPPDEAREVRVHVLFAI